MQIKKCNISDIEVLAEMNKQLIEDEKSDNEMTLHELENRMEAFISTEYDAYFFVENDVVKGYALINNTCNPLYLRQFFIKRDYRKQHLGTKAFFALKEYLNVDSMDIEVLSWNEPGIRFWQSLGFCERSRYMRFVRNTKEANAE